jgi:flagellar basal body rod protein FlgF
LTKTWNFEDLKVNNVDVISAVQLEKVEFNKDGECIFTYSTTTKTYQREFMDKKSKIKITTDGGYERSLFILKLTDSELKWQEEITNSVYEIQVYSFSVSE